MSFENKYEVASFNADINEFKVQAIFNDSYSKEIQILMPKGSMMQEHSAPAPIIVQVLKGEIDFIIDSKANNLKEFDCIRVKANIAHSLIAKDNSIIRLSLFKNDTFSRVCSVKIKQ